MHVDWKGEFGGEFGLPLVGCSLSAASGRKMYVRGSFVMETCGMVTAVHIFEG
jgi:hypothetical protein